MVTKEQVEIFLKEMREKMQILDIAFRPRTKNIDSLAEIDLVPIQ